MDNIDQNDEKNPLKGSGKKNKADNLSAKRTFTFQELSKILYQFEQYVFEFDNFYDELSEEDQKIWYNAQIEYRARMLVTRFSLLGLDPVDYLKAVLSKVEAYNNDAEIGKIKNPNQKIHPAPVYGFTKIPLKNKLKSYVKAFRDMISGERGNKIDCMSDKECETISHIFEAYFLTYGRREAKRDTVIRYLNEFKNIQKDIEDPDGFHPDED